MARVRILRRQNSGYIELPKEMLGYEELELFQLKDGYYLLSVPLGETAKEQKEPAVARSGEITPAERQVLKKLLAIRFEKRTYLHQGILPIFCIRSSVKGSSISLLENPFLSSIILTVFS